MSGLTGKWPAIVRELDRPSRKYRVEIPGLTDGADVLPLAEIAYPIGDKSEHTEIRVLPGDRVWVEFERGDARYPLITAWRTKQTGNVVNFRRWHHENIETDADQTQKHTTGTTYRVEAGESITLIVGGSSIVINGSSITLSSNGSTVVVDASGVALNGAQIKLNG